MSQNTHRSSSRWDWVFRALVVISVVFIILLLLATQIIRFLYLADPSRGLPNIPDLDAHLVLDRAEDAVAATELVLSFLEGASVLIGLGFGAATIYGLRSTQETREELDEEVRKVTEMREEINAQLAALRRYDPQLQQLANLRQLLDESNKTLHLTIENVAELLQADQEFRLRNYETAYDFARKVLNEDPDNPMALYIAGWLEVQHLRDKLDDGLLHLERVAEQEKDWPTAKAAYGVGLRRKAQKLDGSARDQMFLKAESVIKAALADQPRLLDFEGESFWGPVGGILRDRGDFDGAIKAYEEALKVTPDSSYPAGNLATLYLRKAREAGPGSEWYDKALDAYEDTLEAAQAELLTKPNDYYLLMDIAQSGVMLVERGAHYLAHAQTALAKVQRLRVSLNSLETSQRGWQYLWESCPENWPGVRQELERAIATIDSIVTRHRADNG